MRNILDIVCSGWLDKDCKGLNVGEWTLKLAERSDLMSYIIGDNG